jgi:hypothetical protein
MYHTDNHPGAGPAFGAGHDLYLSLVSEDGYAYGFSYGPGLGLDNIFSGTTNGTIMIFSLDRLEIFTIDRFVTTAVPEPTTLASGSLAVLALLGHAWQRRRKRAQPGLT